MKLPALALALDIILVVVFATIGRAQHGEPLSMSLVLLTAWPFLAALLLGHLALRSWHHPVRIWPHGVLLWAITVVGAMALRTLIGLGTATGFVVVTSITLAIFLLGWRLIALLVMRRSRANAAS
ncbi:DUF3054 domain-containing protein [Devriesea agamarum]|uniref:DUF3054 domain-containing protein n=1 Tax=Devriesea agamarum TaxID=472569 RepID=UPI00071DD1B9|nr:DUF3054 domain-containing protein [Devriesea agamarum]